MAMTSVITGESVFGNKKITYGTFTNGAADEGGDINTGLTTVDFIKLEHSGASAVTNAPSVNKTLPCDGSAVTIVTDAGADGYWWAFGS